MIKVSQMLIAYIQEIEGHEGHEGSKGNNAPFVIKSHETGKILSSHPTREKAKEHLKQMHIYGD